MTAHYVASFYEKAIHNLDLINPTKIQLHKYSQGFYVLDRFLILNPNSEQTELVYRLAKHRCEMINQTKSLNRANIWYKQK